MNLRFARGAVLALACCAIPAQEAQAFHCLDWLFGGCCNKGCAAPAPYVTNFAPAQPCCQTVNYMPQTCFRTVYVNQPVTTMMPVQSCDPCTGCPTTTMRPVTSFCMKPTVVPYTTFRPVATACAPSPCATGCGSACSPVASTTFRQVAPACSSGCGTATTTAYPPATFAPAATSFAPATFAPAAASGSCCNASYSAPATTYASPGAPGATIRGLSPQGSAPATYAGPSVGTQTISPQPTSPPTLGSPSGVQQRTFEDSNGNAPESRIIIPDNNSSQYNGFNSNGFNGGSANGNAAPRALDSELQDRMTAQPIRQAQVMRPVSAARPQPIAAPITIKSLDDNGWRAAK